MLQPEYSDHVRTGGAARADISGLVSCIIIFFNEEEYLAEAIESVIAQTHDRWELLLVDDGSSDGSEDIARSYCKRFPDRIRYLTHDRRENRGMSASRNLGLHSARGEYVAFLDGDDCWYPNKLERQVALFAENPSAIMISGATLYWYSWQGSGDGADRRVPVGQFIGKDRSAVLAIGQDKLHAGPELLRRLYPLGRGMAPSSSGNMFRRSTALAIGGHNEAFRGLYEDQVFTSKIYLRGPVFVSQEVFDRYRQHDDSCCAVTRATGQSDKARHQFFLWLSGYLDEVEFRDRRVHWQLRRKKLRHDFPWARRLWARVKTRFGRASA
jgi:glycosyltransferase involved in cell wall biosynthesis